MKGSMAQLEALWGSFIGDALAMPVHWFYNPSDIPRLCGGWIKKFIAPPPSHPTCVLTLSAVDTSGRKGGNVKGTNIIGNVILHDKLKYWQGDPSVHYHQGMNAGDNTLNSRCALKIIETLSNEDPNHDKPLRQLMTTIFEEYVQFLTTPGTHNDTYAESWHRAFFRDWSTLEDPPTKGKALIEFAESRSSFMLTQPPDSQLSSVGALTCAIPWIVHYANADENQAVKAAVEFLKLTHPAKGLDKFVDLYARALYGVLNGQSLKEVSRKALMSNLLGFDSDQLDQLSKLVSSQERGSASELKAFQSITSRMGIACYIKGALSILFFISHHFHDDFKSGILMNVNIGGENCSRGASIGALLGAAAAHQSSNSIPKEFKSGLNTSVSDWLRKQSA